MSAWLRERVPLDPEGLKEFSNEPVPNHLKHWWWCLGGTPILLFTVQVLTGILLTFYYVPSTAAAYDSVARISRDVPFGWYIRSLHHWSSYLMITAVLLHMLRVFFTGAYRRPRELNWMIGLGLLAVTLGFGFTGYSLVYEQLSYWGATVATNLMDAVPVIGPYLGRMLRGGDAVGDNTLTRLFVLHIGVMPTLLALLLALHVLLIRLHGVTPFEFRADRGTGRTYPFFPDHLLKEIIIGLVLGVVLTCLALIFPTGLEERANPLQTPAHIKPEWYFYWAFRWLKLLGLTASVLTLGAAAFLALCWPFIDARIRRLRPRSEASVWIGALAVLGLIALTLWEALAAH